VNIALTKLDYGSVIGRAIQEDADAFGLYAEIVFSSPEPLLLNLFSSSKIPVPNFWRYSEPEVDQKLEALGSVPDVEERLAISSEVEKRVIDDVPAIFLYSQVHALLVNQRVDNIVVNPHEHYQLELARIQK
jgi:ABC-type transport system substrate-binding protein